MYTIALSFFKSSYCPSTSIAQDCIYFLAVMSTQFLFYIDYG